MSGQERSEFEITCSLLEKITETLDLISTVVAEQDARLRTLEAAQRPGMN